MHSLLGLLPAILATAFAQQCPSLDQIVPNPTAFLARNKDEFPTEVFRPHLGTTAALCAAGHSFVDPTLCLKNANGQQKCNLCGPSVKLSFFKYPFWTEYAAIQKEVGAAYGGSERRQDVSQCLRCMAWAEKYDPATGGAPLNPQHDVIKNSVTVSTRIACTNESQVVVNGAPSVAFLTPDIDEIKKLDDYINAQGIEAHDCTLRVPGCNVTDFAARQRAVAEAVRIKENYIEKFVMKYVDPAEPAEGPQAVRGHSRVLMEIPNGQMHVFQARVSAQPGFQGWSEDENLRLSKRYGYQAIGPIAGSNGQFGCSAYEYSMVVASPGTVKTACWLTPMFNDKAAKAAWVAEERRKEAEIQSKVQTAVQEAFFKYPPPTTSRNKNVDPAALNHAVRIFGQPGQAFAQASIAYETVAFCKGFCAVQGTVDASVRVASYASLCGAWNQKAQPQPPQQPQPLPQQGQFGQGQFQG